MVNADSQTESSDSENFSEEERDSLWKLGGWHSSRSDDSTSAWCNVRSIQNLHVKAGFALIILPIILLLSLTQQVTLIVALWLFSHGESQLDPEL